MDDIKETLEKTYLKHITFCVSIIKLAKFRFNSSLVVISLF